MEIDSKAATEEPKTMNKRDEPPQIDREKTCPLLLRVFCNTTGRHNQRSDYNRNVPGNELQIYTWLDATLKELTRLITEVYPNTKQKGTAFNFAVVWPNMRQGGGFRMKDIGQTVIGTKGPHDTATLSSNKFVIGDYLDVAVTIPTRGGGGGGGGGGQGGQGQNQSQGGGQGRMMIDRDQINGDRDRGDRDHHQGGNGGGNRGGNGRGGQGRNGGGGGGGRDRGAGRNRGGGGYNDYR